MMYYELDITPRVIVGADTRTRVGHEARKLGFSRVLVVSDPFHEESGRIDEIAHLLNAAGLEVTVYAGVTAEPDTEPMKPLAMTPVLAGPPVKRPVSAWARSMKKLPPPLT